MMVIGVIGKYALPFPDESMTKVREGARPVFVAMALLGLVLAVYGRTIHHPFVPYDDDKYVYRNAHVANGLTWDGVVWAFTSLDHSNWHPLTWISHMMDVTVFGLNPAGHHAMNFVVHYGNALLFFLVFRSMTGKVLESGIVAALFAIHPLHVESVAWVAERKDLLSTFFWLLALGSYVRYAKTPGRIRMTLVYIFFATALLCKPMVVTFPFLLLLLDYWPLYRFRSIPGETGNNWRRKLVFHLVKEKVPLFVIAVLSCMITYVAQSRGGSTDWYGPLLMETRFANALVAYVLYLWKAFWPSGLAVLYPIDPNLLVPWKVSVAFLFLLSVSIYSVWTARNRPWFAVGWFWYLGTLVPVIGIVQIGLQSMADRYTYIPLSGIFIIYSWGIGEILGKNAYRKYIGAAISISIVMVLAIFSFIQVGHWKSSISLFRHALSVTKNNYVMHTNLGGELLDQAGMVDEAMIHFQEALRINPACWEAHYNLARCWYSKGRMEEASWHNQKAFLLWNQQMNRQ